MATVSAIIATYNRADVLRHALRSLLAQSRVPDEIVVIDDASPDGTRAMMKSEFPQVRYVRTPQNMGQAFNRNLGVMSTTGDYILSIDDDAWFEQPDGLARAIDYMERYPAAGVLALNVRQENGWLYLPPGMAPRPVAAYIGCGCVLRRSVAERTLYVPGTDWGEESDRSLRVYDLGYDVVGIPDIVVFHALSMKNRNWARIRLYGHRNNLIREILRCPLWLLPVRFAGVWLRNTLVNLREGYYLTDARVMTALPFILRVGFGNRMPVSTRTWRKWRAILRQDSAEFPPPQGEKDIGVTSS